jgi:uncharacterized RDD family membrane protein YckC
MLRMRLRGGDIPFSLSEETVSVPQRCADDLREALRWVNEDLAPMPPDYAPRRPFRREDQDGNVVASRWKRLIGWWLDSLVVSLCIVAARTWDISTGYAFVAVGVYFICCTHWFGATVGKLIVKVEVVDADHEHRGRVSWRQSAVRWGATAAPAMLAGLLGPNRVAELLLLISQVVFYAPIQWDPLGQGLHDRLAQTVVLQRPGRNRPHDR